MARYIVFLVFSCLVVYSVTVFFRVGGHKPVEIQYTESYPSVALLSQPHLGAYHKINAVIQVVEDWAMAHNLPCRRSFGKYIDDPKTKDEARLQSFGGCVLDGIQSLSFSEPLPQDFVIEKLPSRPYVLARFEGAPSISPFKVYPKVDEFLEQQGLQIDGPVIEIYSFSGQNEALTEYLFPVLPQ